MTDNRATERLRALLDERGVEYREWDGVHPTTIWHDEQFLYEYMERTLLNGVKPHTGEVLDGSGRLEAVIHDCTPEQAIAAMFWPKAKSHPYGYEPDTGAFDATRCECGCINDISAKYCNGCGGEIEIDEHAEKEIYHTSANMVFAEKHDDGSLEFAGKRYIAATLGSEPDETELTQTYDVGFRNGVMAVFQQLEGIEDYEELQCFIAEYWGEGEGNDEL